MYSYKVGLRICLWQIDKPLFTNRLVVVKEVIVTLNGVKTGVPTQVEGVPSTYLSLRGVGDDGQLYEKHWDRWPDALCADPLSLWSARDDGVDGQVWMPREAFQLYNLFASQRRMNLRAFVLEGLKGLEAIPKGDLVHCEAHDDYSLPGDPCLSCLGDAQRAQGREVLLSTLG